MTKFKTLKANTNVPINTQCVKNLSSKTITETQLKALCLGQNFAMEPSKDKLEFVASIENIIQDTNGSQENKTELR